MADNGFTSTDPAVQARIKEIQRQAEASAAAQRAQAAGQAYNAADIDPSKNAANAASNAAWKAYGAYRQAGIEQAAGLDSSVGAWANSYGTGTNYYSGSNGSQSSTSQPTTVAGSGNTQTAITTPSATSTNTSAVAPGSYMQEGYSTGSERPILDEYSAYYTKAPEAPRSIAEIRQEQLDQAQKAIDATAAIYEEARTRRQMLGRRQLAQTKSQNVSAGLAGSPFAQANTTAVNNDLQFELNALASQRSADISKIFADAEDRAQQLYQTNLNNYYQERDFYVSERDKAIAEEKARKEATKAAATNMITNIAKGGYSIDEMNPDEYKQLLANSGMSDFEARAIWAASSPAANAQYSVQNGYLVGTYFDPHTGKPVVTTTLLPKGITPVDVGQIQLADGSVVLYDKNNPRDEFGNLIRIPFEGQDVTKPKETGGLSDPQKASIFNSIVSKYNSSPLILASDRLPVLQAAIDAIQENPEDAALQLNLSYAYIQALDTYQSSVREGELQNLNSIDSKIGNIENYIGQIQNGQIVRPEVAQQIAEAAKNIVDTIHGAASQKAQSFASQANVAGVGEEWQQYLGGFTQNYAQGSSEIANTPDDSGIVFNQSYNSVSSITQEYPELQQDVQRLLEAGYSDAEITQYFNGKYGAGGQSFSNDQSMSLNYSPEATKNIVGIKKVAMKFAPGEYGGQCGRFVNKLTGFRVGDSYASKMAITDPKIGKGNNPPMPGDVFVFPYKKTGHIGFIESVQRLADGTYKLGVIDSNYHLNEKVDRHFINSKIVTGYARPKQIIV
jgi:hypothetical protein